MDGGDLAVGPGVRAKFGDTGSVDTHAAWSTKNYKAADALLNLPLLADNRVRLQVGADWIDAPDVAFYGTGNDSKGAGRIGYFSRATTVGVTASLQAAPS